MSVIWICLLISTEPEGGGSEKLSAVSDKLYTLYLTIFLQDEDAQYGVLVQERLDYMLRYTFLSVFFHILRLV